MEKTTNKNITCSEPLKVIYLNDELYKQAVRNLKTTVDYKKNNYLIFWGNENVILNNIDTDDFFNFKLKDTDVDIESNKLQLIFEHI